MRRTLNRVGLIATISLMAATAADAQPERIHAIGYSLTYNTICGTQDLFFIGPNGQECALYSELGGGVVPVWWEQIGPPLGLKWRRFRNAIEFNGVPTIVYWQIAFHWQQSSQLTPGDLDALLEIADKIRALAPGATIYVSGMAGYSPPLCERVNRKAIEKSWNAAGVLWGSAADIRMGPILPDISPDQTAGSGDPCHLGPVGKAYYGALLHEFFDALVTQPPPESP